MGIDIHPKASYSTSIFGELLAKADLPHDTRDGIGWIANAVGSALTVRCDARCDDCSSLYTLAGNPTGHIAPTRLHAGLPVPSACTMTRTVIRRFHKFLFELFYAGNKGLPGQIEGVYVPTGGVTKYVCEIVSIAGARVTVAIVGAVDPRTIPIRPNDVVFFQGGTNFDDHIFPIVDDVDYGDTEGPGWEFDVTLSWNVENLLLGMGTPADARLVICQYPRPYYTTLFAHEQIPVKKKIWTILSTDPEWPVDAAPNYGCLVLKNHDGLDCRTPRPIRESETPPGYVNGVGSDANGTIKVEVWDAVGGWADITATISDIEVVAGIVVKYHWRRLQTYHEDTPTEFETRLYLMTHVPATTDDPHGARAWYSFPEPDLLAGKTKIRVTYYPEYLITDPSRWWMGSQMCTNCQRDYSEWIATCNTDDDRGLDIDANGGHWFCLARNVASGVDNFLAGRCSQQRCCSHFDWGGPGRASPRALAEIENGKWICERQLVVAEPETTMDWVLGPSIYLLGGHYFDTPNQFHTAIATLGNGCLGWWLNASLGVAEAAWTAHQGAIYQINYTPADFTDYAYGLLPHTSFGCTNTAQYRSNRRAESGDENATSDPTAAHRVSLLRKVISVVQRTVNLSALFFLRARVASNYYEGENRVQRCVPQLSPENLYFPAIRPAVADETVEYSTGSAEKGSWMLGGVEYSIKLTVTRVGKSYGKKHLGGLNPNAYGEDPNDQGRVWTVAWIGGRLRVYCYPGEHNIAQTGGPGADVEIQYIAGGNIVEIPDCHRPRSAYEYYTYRKAGDVLDKAFAGDTIEFVDAYSLTDKKFYVYWGNPCSGPAGGGAIPGGVTGFACTDNTIMLNTDTLEITDENGLLAAALAANEFPVGEVGNPDVRFYIRSDGVFAPEGSITVTRFLVVAGTATPTAVAAGNLWIERARGEVYLKKSYVDTWKNDAGQHCLRVNGQLVMGV